MSLPRPKTKAAAGLSGGGFPPPAVGADSGAVVTVLAVASCIIDGIRRDPGERFEVAADRAEALASIGYVMPDALFALMRPEAAAMWRTVGTEREALLEQSLAVSPELVDRLWDGAGRVLTPDGVPTTVQPAAGAATFRVLQLTQYDPGSAVYRYHSAANTVPGVRSAFVRYGYSNPHCHLRQWDGELHRQTVELLAMTADVIHCHMDYRALHQDLRYVLRTNQRAAITYHGSVLPGNEARVFVDTAADQRMRAIRFGARPYHQRYGVEHYLPIPMPVADYAALAASEEARAVRSAGTFRVAHSPTKRAIKGTAEFLEAVAAVQARGIAIEPVLIEDMAHGAALQLKATCHATFDAFWLGMQGSGLEAAAMGQAVLAGDADAAREAAALNGGAVPWTFCDSGASLAVALERLATDAAYYTKETARVGRYVKRVHDYSVVGAQYATILQAEVLRGIAERC